MLWRKQAEDAMNMTCTDVQAGGTIVPAQQHLLPLGLPTDSGHECFSRLFFIITYYYLYFRSGRNCFLGWRLAFCTGLRGSPFTTSTPARQQALPSFTNHVPTEFEATAHYLKDDHGDDIEPKATNPGGSGKSD